MAHPHHLAQLDKGTAAWNTWRIENPDLRPDLSLAQLEGRDIDEADLSGTNLRRTQLSNASLVNAAIMDADLSGATLNGTPGWTVPSRRTLPSHALPLRCTLFWNLP